MFFKQWCCINTLFRKKVKMCVFVSTGHCRITGWLRLEETSGGCLVQLPCSCRATWTQLPRTMYRQLLKTSKDRNAITSLCSMYQGSVTLTISVSLLAVLIIALQCPTYALVTLGHDDCSVGKEI